MGEVRKHPLAECEKCPWRDVSGFAGGEGPEDADLIIVGEAPGQKEVQTGKPFSGPSGQLLNMVLKHHGIDREKVFVTNVALCHPPYEGGNKSVAPPPAVIKACWPRLKAEIDNHPKARILALGNTAARTILDDRNGILSLRTGPPKRSRYFPDQLVVATIHPAACLRIGDHFPSLVTDVGKLKVDLWKDWQEPRYKVFDNEAEVLQVLKLIEERFDTIALDIEVGVDKDADFSHPDELLCIGLSYKEDTAVVLAGPVFDSRRVRAVLADLLEHKTVICHNGKYDIQVLMRLGIISKPNLNFDTMLASYVLDERPGVHGLKYLATEILGAPPYAEEIKRYLGPKDSYSVIPKPVLYRYNAYDVALTFNLFEHFSRQLEKEGHRDTHDFLVDAANALMIVERDGVKIDLKYLDELTESYLSGLEGLEENLRKWVANPRSPKQVKEALYDLGFRVESTNEETLRALVERTGYNTEAREFLDLMLEHRREQKLYGTYIKGTRKRLVSGRVYPTFLLHGTTTGRLACRNPNLQNVPRESKIRKLFVPEEGNVFVQADYSQAELRVIAVLSEDKYLLEVLGDPARDIHGEVATQFYGTGWTKEQRIRAKAVVFGLAYGREEYSLANEFKISITEARHYMDTFFQQIPGVVAWRDQIRKTALTGGILRSPFGRERRFHLITKDNQKDIVKEALAFLPQSTASDICLGALRRLVVDYKLAVRIPVHDSLLVECRREVADQVAEQMTYVMEQEADEMFARGRVPFRVDVSIGNNWGEV